MPSSNIGQGLKEVARAIREHTAFEREKFDRLYPKPPEDEVAEVYKVGEDDNDKPERGETVHTTGRFERLFIDTKK